MDEEERQDSSFQTDTVDSANRSVDRNGDSIVTEPEYQAVFETIDDAVFVFDVEYDGDRVSFSFRQNNPAHEEITHITVEEFGGESPEEILGAEKGAEVAAEYRRCVETEETVEYHETIEHPTGTVEWHTKLTPLFEDGAVTRIVGISRDITDQKKRERELTQTRERLRALFEEAPDGVVVHDAEGQILDVNETICEQLGYTHEELLSMDVFDIDVSLDEEAFKTEWQSMEVGPMHRLEVEGRHRRKDGSTFPVEVWVSKVRPNGPESDQFVALIRDITDRKKRERELERYEKLWRNLPVGVCRVDPAGDGEFIEVNDTLVDIAGAESREALLEQSIAELWEDESEREAVIEQVSKTGRETVEHRFETLEGRTVWLRLIVMAHEREAHFDVVVQDITDRRQRDIHLEKAQEVGNIGWWRKDIPSDTIYWSENVYEMWGAEGSGLIDHETFLEYIHPEDEEYVDQAWQAAKEGEAYDIEHRVVTGNGKTRWMREKADLTFENGQPVSAVGIVQDITERKERERELQRHRTYLESTNDMVTLIEPDGTIEYVSSGIERILGFEPEELVGENGFEYVHPDDRPDRLEDIEELVESPDEETLLEFRFQQADGSYRWIESTARNLLDDPDVEHLLLSSRDITERKKYEQRLSTLHDTTRRIIDAESKQEVAEITVDAAQDLLEFSLPSVWYPVEDGTELTLVANSEEHQALLEKADTPEPMHSADSWLWDVIEADETVVRSPLPTEDLAADVPIQSAVLLSLGEHGIFACGAKGEVEFSDREIRIAEILAQNVRTALDQLDQREALERQKAFTDDLLDAIEDVVYVLDTDGDFEQWNAALEEVTGYQYDEIDSMNVADLFAEEDAGAVEAAVEETFEAGRTRVELDFLTANGESIPYEFIAHTFEDPTGEPVMAGIGRDRSAHVEYEQQLKEERDFFERTIESLPYPFYVLNADDYTIEHANSLATVSEGETCYEVTHNRAQPCDEGDQAIACPLSDVSESAEPQTVEHVHYDEDGNERVYQVHAAPILDSDGNVVQMAESNIDITERVTYEQRLEEQRDNLSVLNQVVRHDIRNDMTVVKGRANLLDEYVDQKGQDDLEAVLEATENAIELTKTARDLSETMLSTEEDVESVRLDQHLAPPIENARSKFDDAIITVEDRIPEVTVRGNKLLEAVFRNLIQNAVVHNDKEAPTVEISTTAGDETLTVTIADNGPGIPDDQKETIFGKGEKGLDSPGTGIGLYLVRTLVDQYGGDVWVEDNEPEGSVFYVELPQVERGSGQ